MANASSTAVTVVNTAMVVSGSVNGTLAVGQTVVGAGVPTGVTIVSFGTGTGTQGTYTVSASSANVSTAEPMGFFLYQQLATIGNAMMPQLADLRLAAGLALLISPANISNTAAPGARYTFGTHAVALYNSQSGGRIWNVTPGASPKPSVSQVWAQPQYVEPPQPQITKAQSALSEIVNLKTTLRTIIGAPQSVDLTQQAVLFPVFGTTGGVFGHEYQFGTHQNQIYDSQNRSLVFPSVRKPPVVASQVPLRSFHVNPQELYSDVLTLQGSFSQPIVETGWILTMITAGPQLADLTLSAQMSYQQIQVKYVGPRPITSFYAAPQADPSPPPQSFSQSVLGATQQIKPTSPTSFFASPTPWDTTVTQGLIYRGPSATGKQLQPARIFALEEQVDRTTYPQLIINASPIFIPPPPVVAPVAPPPTISEWTTDATQVTADTINFTCDGTNLIAGGGLPTDPTPPESSGSGNPGPVRNVSQNLRF